MHQKELINDVLINKKFFALAIDQGTSLKEIINPVSYTHLRAHET